MASLTQQPLLNPLPNLEPPSFALLRDLLSRKLITEEANPYGFTGSGEGLFNPQGRGMFDPYGGGYGSQGGNAPGGNYSGPTPTNQIGGLMTRLLGPRATQPPGPPQQTMAAPLMPQGSGGGYGFDGYTLNGQISREGNFDGKCAMGHDGCMGHDGPMPGAPPSPMVGPQPGATMAPNPRMMHGGMHPHTAAAMRAIMAALMAKRRGLPPRPGMVPKSAAHPMGMDSPYSFQRGPMAPLGMDATTNWNPTQQGGYSGPVGGLTNARMPFERIESMGMPWLQRNFGGPSAASGGQQFQTGQWGLPTYHGFQYTGAQHEMGGNPYLAQLFANTGASPSDFAHFLMQGSQAQSQVGMDPASIAAHQAAGQDRFGNAMPQAGGAGWMQGLRQQHLNDLANRPQPGSQTMTPPTPQESPNQNAWGQPGTRTVGGR